MSANESILHIATRRGDLVGVRDDEHTSFIVVDQIQHIEARGNGMTEASLKIWMQGGGQLSFDGEAARALLPLIVGRFSFHWEGSDFAFWPKPRPQPTTATFFTKEK